MHSQPHSAAPEPAAAPRLDEVYGDAVSRLRGAGVATPELDARLLACRACGLTHEQFAADPARPLMSDEIRRIGDAIARRCAREPVSRILGLREFWGLEFMIGPETLDPRPDTETLVQAVLDLAHGRRDLSILDLGTGSGCILISLLHEIESATGVGLDVSEDALAIARENAARHGVAARAEFLRASWNDWGGQGFDFVVSNPPYIPSTEITGLEPEVARYDPRLALDGGSEGLQACREILARARDFLKPSGWLVLEIGDGQADGAHAMIAEAGRTFDGRDIRCRRDLGGRVRCVLGKRSPTT